MSDIDFRDTLLSMRQRITDVEQWYSQDNQTKAKENMLELSNLLRSAAEYHFSDVECFRDYFKDYNIPSSKESEHLVPEAYLMVCSECGDKWVKKADSNVNSCSECGNQCRIYEELYPGNHTVPKIEVTRTDEFGYFQTGSENSQKSEVDNQ